MLLAAGSASANGTPLAAGFGTEYLGANPEGTLNGQEYIADTDPTNALSVLSLAATPSSLIFQTLENSARSALECTDPVGAFSSAQAFGAGRSPCAGLTDLSAMIQPEDVADAVAYLDSLPVGITVDVIHLLRAASAQIWG